jgi:dTDP-4-dehydrorhamnose 3,5-epimerase
MHLEPLEMDGVYGIVSEPFIDQRGAFFRLWDAADPLLGMKLFQVSIATNMKSRTLRGLHYQVQPGAETKVAQCISGEVFDVIVDVRVDSRSYGDYLGISLGSETRYRGIIIPPGFAHGYLTLSDNSNMIYFMDGPHSAELSRGIIWNDPTIGVDWPFSPQVISQRDLELPCFVVE